MSIDQSVEQDRIAAEIIRSGKSNDPFAAAVRTTRMPMLITDPSLPDNPIVFVNDAFSRLTGFTRDEVINKNCRFLQGPATSTADVAAIRDSIARRVPIEVDLKNYKKNGETFWNRLLISPVFDSEGMLTYFFASQFDVTAQHDRLAILQKDRRSLEAELEKRLGDLTRSEERLRFIIDAGRLGYWTLDLGENRFVASDVCKANFGRSASDALSYDDLLASIATDDQIRMSDALKHSIESRGPYEVQFRVTTPSGQQRWVEMRGQAFFRADGTPLSVAGVSIDITGQRLAEEQKNLMMRELNHRVKNSMATILSIANQTLRSANSLEQAKSTLNARILSMAAAHDVLTYESWSGATLGEIAQGALRPFIDTFGDRIRFGGPHLRVSPRVAISISLALHEMSTNAVKYGALSNDQGQLIFNWDDPIHQGERRLELKWQEIGGPKVEKPEKKGFGTKLIETILAMELGGKAAIDFRPNGLTFSLTTALQNVVEDTGSPR